MSMETFDTALNAAIVAAQRGLESIEARAEAVYEMHRQLYALAREMAAGLQNVVAAHHGWLLPSGLMEKVATLGLLEDGSTTQKPTE